jgi:hypothetical protein
MVKDSGAITINDAREVVVGQHFEVRPRVGLVPRYRLIALTACAPPNPKLGTETLSGMRNRKRQQTATNGLPLLMQGPALQLLHGAAEARRHGHTLHARHTRHGSG